MGTQRWKWAAILLAGAQVALVLLVLAAGGLWGTFRREEMGNALGAVALYGAAAWLALGALCLARFRPREFALLIVSLAVTCAVVEIAVRYAIPERAMMRFRWQQSRQYHHIAPANRTMFKTWYEGNPILIITNEDGLRSTYSRADFAAHPTRIVMMGDSFTYGYGVRQEYAFPEAAQRLIRGRLGRDDVAVLNAGIVSYSPFLANLLFDGVVRAYKPQLVLYFLDATDFGDDYFYAAQAQHDGDRVSFDIDERRQFYYGVLGELAYKALERPPASRLVDWAAWPKTFLARRLWPGGADAAKGYYDFDLTIDGVRQGTRYFIYKHPLEKLRPYFEATLEHVNRLERQVRAAGAAFVLVIVPRFHHWNPNESPEYWERDEYRVDEPHQFAYFEFFDEVKDRLPYPVFSLLPAFQATDEYPLTFRRDAHWTEDGHDFVARVVTDHLIEQGLVP
ncbi:MAG TPA: GDSL-type esterase/lipase family protein [Candidatus Hydrogenedentes bacterium]|nr:GDSL-type esterase/lipase family protein [Candidatus Hydrogenedentota bacterium]HNT87071.1 GDSL-type esterase/lipase family protein [Candidatus Hydrogenedentota bacterium]